MGPVSRTTILVASLIALLSGAAAIGSHTPTPVSAAGIFDPQYQCIHDVTKAPVSIAGNQFLVRSNKADEGVAKTVAATLNSQDVFQKYEKGLGISSLLQPGEDTLPMAGGVHPFPIFIDPNLDPDLDGVFAPLCNHPTWGSLVVSATLKTQDEIVATTDHELFHAAQFALLGELTTPGPNWWFEATAVAAEAWFGSKDPAAYDHAFIDHPEKPVDAFTYKGLHPYGAYRFVQWLLGSGGMPTGAGWSFLRDSFEQVKSLGPTAGVDAAITSFNGSTLADQVGSFWADHTNPQPKFGATAPLETEAINQPAQTVTLTPAVKLAADLVALKPSAGEEQLEVIVDKLPAKLELFLNYGDGEILKLQPGESMDELFCRTGNIPGSYPLPKTGDVRLAMTTTEKNPPPSVNVKVLTTTTVCPKQLLIVPGFEIGSLHLAMSHKEANSAAKPVGCGKPINFPGNIVYQGCLYAEAPKAYVVAGFINGRVGYLVMGASRRFVTTTGIGTWSFTGKFLSGDDGEKGLESIPGSTEQEFVGSGTGAGCESFGKNPENNHICYYQESKDSRYTFAVTKNQSCSDDQTEDGLCFWPAPGFYVGGIGVATQQAYDGYTCLEYGLNCPSGSARPGRAGAPLKGLRIVPLRSRSLARPAHTG
jgi:hypothetical protein